MNQDLTELLLAIDVPKLTGVIEKAIKEALSKMSDEEIKNMIRSPLEINEYKGSSAN